MSRAIAHCELTHLHRAPIDLDRARVQHAAYEDALRTLGLTLHRLPEAADLPDSVFVEDTAVVLDELAIISRPGAATRRPETAAVADALVHVRPLRRIAAPATLDGGDVLRLERTLYVGRSRRTNDAGIEQLQRYVQPFGYRVEPVPIDGCLHLKSAVTRVGPDVLLKNHSWVDPTRFAGWQTVEVHPAEPLAANALLVNGTVLHPAAFVRTRERLASAGIVVWDLDVSELAKAEGGLTCCSLILT